MKLRTYIILAVLGLIGVTGFFWFWPNPFWDAPAPQRALTLSNISTITGIKFPEQAKLLNHQEFAWIDYTLLCKIQIPTPDLETMLTHEPFSLMHLEGPESGPSDMQYQDRRLAWWDTANIQNWKEGNITRDKGSLQVLIDLDRTDPCIVYMVWMRGDASMNQADIFWAWFRKNENRFRHAKDSVDEALLDEFREQLHHVSEGLFFEFGGKPEGPSELVITADGDPEYFSAVRELVSAAPAIPGWTFIAFKPAMGFQYILNYNNLALDPSKMWFLPLEASNEPAIFGIRVAVPKYEESRDEDYLHACWLCLDSGLGEEHTAEEIQHVEVCAVPENPEDEGFIELIELTDYIEWRKQKLLEQN
jgi:hypothetical protein